MASQPGAIRSLLRNPWILASFSCLLVAAAISLFAHYIWRTDIGNARIEFHRAIDDTTAEVETKLREYEHLIRALALIANLRGMESAGSDWRHLVAQLLPAEGGRAATAISLVGYVPKRALYPAQDVVDVDSGPIFSTPILNIDRDAIGRSLIGYDINIDSIRREALESARDKGGVAITSPVILARDQHAGASVSFLLVAPVYAGRPSSVQERRAAIRGYVVAAYRVRDLVAPILPRLASRTALTIADPSDGYAPLIYHETDAPNPGALFQDRHGLQVADRIWLLTYQSTPDYERRLHEQHAFRIGAIGLLLSLLVGLLVWRLTRSWGQAEARVHGVSGELRRYQNLLRTVLDVIPEPVLVKDRNFRLLLVNQAYADRAGIPVEQLIGRDTSEFMPPLLANRLHEADKAVFESRQDQVFELSIPNQELNSARNYIITKRLSHDADGKPIVVGIHSDVTELRRKIAEFAAVIEQTPLVAVQGFDRNCVLTHWNKASESLFGYAADRAIGSRLQDLILEPRMQQVFERTVEDAWTEHRAFGPREVRLRLPDGRMATLLLTLFPVIVEGLVLELFSMAVDVSARHEAEQQLALHRDNLQRLVDERTAGLLRAKQDLEKALHARSEFLANMSHELRTPMHAVLSFAQLGATRADKLILPQSSPSAEEDKGVEKLRDYFSRIALSGERLLGLINNLLDLSKLEAGKMHLNRRETDLVALVHEVAGELELLAGKSGLSLALPPREMPVLLEVDAERMRQVVSNLLSNAIRFSPPGGRIEVGLAPAVMRLGRRATDSIEHPAVRLTVADVGTGIPNDELELIFDKFMQSSTARTGAGGTGLGLAICREIVLAHQGTISASNRVGGGAVFEVVLPCNRPESAAD
jgi:PAS domain S-box-containing protein